MHTLPRYTDAGVNWSNPRLQKRREAVIDSALDNGVDRWLCIATELTDYEFIQANSPQGIDWRTSFGLHPHYASCKALSELLLNATTILANDKKICAIGETGLDFARMLQTKADQLDAFEAQLELAERYKLPVYLHQREAHDDVERCLAAFDISHGIAHCFTEGRSEIRSYLDRGLYIGITGWLCDERRNQDLLDALNYLPLDRLIIETDAPYLLARDLRPKPKSGCAMPSHIPHVAATIARLKNVPIEAVRRHSEANVSSLFDWPR